MPDSRYTAVRISVKFNLQISTFSSLFQTIDKLIFK